MKNAGLFHLLGLTSGVALLSAPFSSSAAEVLRVGITPTTPPMIYREGKTPVGMEADFARALGEHLQRPIEFVAVKWEDQIPSLVKGKTDIIMSSMSVTRGRMMQVNFSSPYMRVGQMALVRGEDRGRYLLGFPAGMSSPIGVKKGTTGDFLVQQEWPKARRRTYRTGDDAAKALLKKRIDLFVADATLIWWLSGTYESKGLTAMPFLLSDEQLAWAVRKNDPELLKQANAFLKDIQADGRFETILRRWLPQAP
jgi:polar amino acid transport system substrate-binding protein